VVDDDDDDDAVTSEVRLDKDNDGEETVAVVTSPPDARETEKRESIPGKGARSSSSPIAVGAKDVVVVSL
jgi:hypothetical protein